MVRSANAQNLWGSRGSGGSTLRDTAGAVGSALRSIVQPDLFGVRGAEDDRLAASRWRLARARRRAAVRELLAEPWLIGETDDPPAAVALARRFLRRHPERDRADPAPPLLTAAQEAALWHAEEAMTEREEDLW